MWVGYGRNPSDDLSSFFAVTGEALSPKSSLWEPTEPNNLSGAEYATTIAVRVRRHARRQAVQLLGCCCVEQWNAPPPTTTDLPSSATGRRPGNIAAIARTAASSAATP